VARQREPDRQASAALNGSMSIPPSFSMSFLLNVFFVFPNKVNNRDLTPRFSHIDEVFLYFIIGGTMAKAVGRVNKAPKGIRTYT
jgi:hypothetical protein